MWLAAEPGANVVIPQPGFPTFSALPESLGLETRFYPVLRGKADFESTVEEIKRLADARTKFILINSPHSPTGATIDDAEMEAPHDFASAKGIQLVSDEVYHPIYHGPPSHSAARLPHATTIGDFSKAFPLAGTRTGWMIEHDPGAAPALLERQGILHDLQFQHRGAPCGDRRTQSRRVLRVTQEAASRNLEVLERFMAERRDRFGWIRPRGGITAFPWFGERR